MSLTEEKGGRVSKALGQCEKHHVNVVSTDDLEAACQYPHNKAVKKGAPKSTVPPCGKPMVEWALNGRKEE